MRKLVTALCCAVLFGYVPAKADDWNKKTVVTFSQPVELPGIVLPAGTYVFKLYDSLSDRHVVQVFNSDETHICATILAIPNLRLTPTADTVMRFAERPIGTPEAMKAWFYPGDSFGQEFVYPKARAVTLANETRMPVLAGSVTPEENPEEIVKAPVETVEPETMAVAPAEPEHPVEAEVAPSAVEAEPLPAPMPVPLELPKTASPIPAIGLLGAFALGLGAFTRLLARS